MVIIALIINCGLIWFFTCSFYPFIGLAYTILSLAGTLYFCNREFGKCIINKELRFIDNRYVYSNEANIILLSAAFLSLGIKLGAAIALFVYTGATLLLTFCILLAMGYFFEGTQSGITVGLAYSIAKLCFKLYQLLDWIPDKIAELLVWIEFKLLGIETKH